MSTFAAGRWKTPGRKTVESCPVLDVNQLSRWGIYYQAGLARGFSAAMGLLVVLFPSTRTLRPGS